jgi:uronate dehydrogenase
VSRRRAAAGRARVAVTGAGGLVGQVLDRGLPDRIEVTRLDRRRSRRRGIAKLEMTDLHAAERAFLGHEVVVDLASANWKEPWGAVHANNLPATWNALEAARRAGVRRVIYASSNHVVGRYEHDEPYARILGGDYGGIRPDDVPRIGVAGPVRPDSPYGVGKAFGEAAGRYYAETFGLSVICLRIGSVNWSGRPESPRHFSTLLSHADLIRLIEACIDVPSDVGFAIVYGVSANTWCIWDLEPGRAIGYEPQDDAEAWRDAR